MKSVLAILLFLVPGHSVVAKDRQTKPVLFCKDPEAKYIEIKSEAVQAIETECKSIRGENRNDCYTKATSTYCRSGSQGPNLYGDFKEISNTTSCTDLANKFLEKRKLGRLDKPAASVSLLEPVKKSVSGQPAFQFNISSDSNKGVKEAVYASSKVDSSGAETWTLAVKSFKNVPSFEPPYEYSPDVRRVLADHTEDGDYQRWYRFKVVNNVCVLDKIDIEFMPKNGRIATRSINQGECNHAASHVYMANLHKSFVARQTADVLDPWLCNESIVSFNLVEPAAVKPHVTNETRSGRGQKTPDGRVR